MDNDRLSQYIQQHISPEHPVLQRVYRDTWLYRLYPRMCSGHLQGSILAMLAAMARPRRILEIGTFSGYSALALASGAPEDAQVHTVELDDEHADTLRGYFDASPWGHKITLHIGDALSVVPAISAEPWDMAYIDANKRQYVDYYRMLKPLMAPGGFILADNTLWDGKVADPAEASDPQCRGIMEFNDMVGADADVEKTILPLRDGLTIIRINKSI